MGEGLLVEQFGVLVLEFGDDVFVEEEGGDGEVGVGEVLVELRFLDDVPNHSNYMVIMTIDMNQLRFFLRFSLPYFFFF
jgi:hypothetical protein